jgi:hypothetical protein
MKTSISKLVTILTVAVSTLSTASYACGGGGNKGGGFSIGYSKNGFGVGFGVGPGSSLKKNHNHNYNQFNNGSCHDNGGFGGGLNDYGFEPFHSYYICEPGDTFSRVALKEYRTSAAGKYIAQFNRLQLNSVLVPGQRLLLPSVSRSGRLTQSRAPAPFNDVTTKATSGVSSNLASSAKAADPEPALPKFSVGSTLLVDGLEFGEEEGVARLRISGLSFPIEVIEWTSSSTKIRLPELEVSSPTKADIEILRADGSLASKSTIELTPAETKLAQKD